MNTQATALPKTDEPEEKPVVIDIEVVASELAPAVADAGLEPATAQGLLNSFAPLLAKAKGIFAEAKEISVTDATQVTEIKQARAARLALRAVRVEADKLRARLKEDSLRRGKAIQGAYHIIEYAIAPVEERLGEMEKFAERAEAARKAKLKEEREEALAPYVANTSFYQLGEMGEDAWRQLFEGAKAAHEARITAEKKAEEERIAREKAEAEERERQRQENERLKREAAEREAALKAEREAAAKAKAEAEARERELREKAERERREAEEKARREREEADAKARKEREAAEKKAAEERATAEAKAKAEREARERAEAELRKAREAEATRKAAEEKAHREREEAEAKARRNAAQAPDREKVASFAKAVRALPVPAASSEEGKRIADLIAAQVEKFAKWVEAEAAKLGGEEGVK